MRGIILSRRDFREYDQIISVYTHEHGKQELLVRGVKKIISKHAAFLEPYSWVELEVAKGQEVGHLIRVQPISLFKHVREDLLKSAMAYYMVGIIEQFVSGQEKDDQIYIIDFLASICKYIH